MLTLTPRATNLVLEVARRSQAEGLALRVAAQRTPQGDVRCGLGFDEEREADARLQFGELTVLVGEPSQALLDDMVMDISWDEGETEPSFHFVPRAELAAALDSTSACAASANSAEESVPAGGACGGRGGCSGCRS